MRDPGRTRVLAALGTIIPDEPLEAGRRRRAEAALAVVAPTTA